MLSGAKVVVTGGAGNVGSQIIDSVIANGAREAVALDAMVRGVPENLAPAIATGKARLVEIDIRDREAVRANIEGADVVFHLAALRWTRCQENPRECQEVMVDGTFNVLEAAADAKVKRVVMSSSAVVYGEPKRLPIQEDEALNGTTVYGAAKIANEQMGRAFAHLRDLPNDDAPLLQRLRPADGRALAIRRSDDPLAQPHRRGKAAHALRGWQRIGRFRVRRRRRARESAGLRRRRRRTLS